MGAVIGFWAALALTAPAAMRPINLNLPPPPPPPPAQANLPPNFLAPGPVPPPRPAWLPPWLFPDPSKATYGGGRHSGGHGPGRLFGGGHGRGGACHGGGHR